jgi:hypothetical protein
MKALVYDGPRQVSVEDVGWTKVVLKPALANA